MLEILFILGGIAIGYGVCGMRLIGHIHDWSPWSDTEESPERPYRYSYRYQSRTCRSCNFTEERQTS